MSSGTTTMTTVLTLASLVSLSLAITIPSSQKATKTVVVSATTVDKQYKLLELLQNLNQNLVTANYYSVGKNYDIKANIKKYEKPEIVEKFLTMEKKGFLPKFQAFSIYNDKITEQAKVLFQLFYSAKEFETFYKTAAYARVYHNEEMFAYTFYVAVTQRLDTKDLVLPPFYEVLPMYYVNHETLNKVYYGKMRGEPFEENPEYSIAKKGNNHFYFQNYSDYQTYGNESKLAYLTEDIGWNTHFVDVDLLMPSWLEGDQISPDISKRRGDLYYKFYQKLLAHYYFMRLTNDMGEIPTFSWDQPYKYGYRPQLATHNHSFAQRPDNYVIQNNNSLDDLRYVSNYEDMFLTFLEQGQFSAFGNQVDFSNDTSINFVGNFWQGNPDLYEKLSPRPHYVNSYERAARRILGGAPSSNGYEFIPTALGFPQTSLRDPAFYQIYNKIWRFMTKHKHYLRPYSPKDLQYDGVNIEKVQVSKLETFFDFHVFNISNSIYYSDQELSSGNGNQYFVIQPSLNNEPFTIKISIESPVEEMATIKIFLGPKQNSFGKKIKLEENWMNFVDLDWFSQKLNPGQNVIERTSDDFFFYKKDPLSNGEIRKLLKESKLPYDMIYKFNCLPKRLMLPKGTKAGFPAQIFVVVYKGDLPKELKTIHTLFLDKKPLGYPFDRPVSKNFFQSNMKVQDVIIYHKGTDTPKSFDFSTVMKDVVFNTLLLPSKLLNTATTTLQINNLPVLSSL